MQPPYRILVVDDDIHTADALAVLLEDDEHEVRTAYNGQEAVARAASFKPHLIILDIHMPVMDGFKAARALRHARGDGQKLMLIALSGLVHAVDRAEARDSGFDMILPKPIEGAQMRFLVDSLLARTTAEEAAAAVHGESNGRL